MVWAIAIVCLTLSCDPLPVVSGYFFSELDCRFAVRLIIESWKPDLGLYEVGCFPRSSI
jgi:hypothetical protein